jgi:membrane fusion protein, multidrug efflux system
LKWRTRIAIAVGVGCVAGAGAWQICGRGDANAASRAEMSSIAIPVTTASAEKKNVPDYIESFGTVQSIDSVAVLPRVSGQIVKVMFKPGDEVRAGQPLFLIDPRPYQAALDQAKGQLSRDRAALKQAQMDLARYQKLAATEAVPEQQAQDQVYVVQRDQGTVQLDRANVESATLNLAYCRIASPISGRAGALLVDQGNYVNTASAASLVSITQLRPIYVSFTVPQAMLNQVRKYQAKRALEVDVFSQAGKPLSRGTVTLIDNQVSATTGTVMMQGTFANTNMTLWPGEFVNVRLRVFTRRNVITVPKAAVMQGPAGSYVYVIRPHDTVRRVNVDVAARQGRIAVIANGLSDGESVVTNGQYRLANNVRVRIRESSAPS